MRKRSFAFFKNDRQSDLDQSAIEIKLSQKARKGKAKERKKRSNSEWLTSSNKSGGWEGKKKKVNTNPVEISQLKSKKIGEE